VLDDVAAADGFAVDDARADEDRGSGRAGGLTPSGSRGVSGAECAVSSVLGVGLGGADAVSGFIAPVGGATATDLSPTGAREPAGSQT
jgi:hypothetical protein